MPEAAERSPKPPRLQEPRLKPARITGYVDLHYVVHSVCDVLAAGADRSGALSLRVAGVVALQAGGHCRGGRAGPVQSYHLPAGAGAERKTRVRKARRHHA